MNFTVADIDIDIDIDEVLDLPPTDILKILELLGLGCLLSLILWLALSRRRRNRPPRPLPLLITVIARRYFWEYELWQVNGNSMSKKTVISRGQRMGRVNHMWVDHMLVIPEDRSVKFTVISPQGVICRWQVPGFGIDYLASPNRFVEEWTIFGEQGASSWVPCSEPAYPNPLDESFPMPIVINVGSQRYFDVWFSLNQTGQVIQLPLP